MSWGGLLFLIVMAACVGPFIISALLGIAKGFRLHLNRIDCPVCEKRVPFASRPTSVRQAQLGGWTCRDFGAELDEMGVDMSPLIEATRRHEEAKFVSAIGQDGGTPLEKVIDERD